MITILADTPCIHTSQPPNTYEISCPPHLPPPLYTSHNKSSITAYFLAYADDVNILAGSIHTLKENAEALVAATREIGLEVSADKTKYMVMSGDQNVGRNHSVRTDNSTFERVEKSLNIWEQL